jgi:hypothetical protein
VVVELIAVLLCVWRTSLDVENVSQRLESARRVGLHTHLFEHSRVAELVTLLDTEGVLG